MLEVTNDPHSKELDLQLTSVLGASHVICALSEQRVIWHLRTSYTVFAGIDSRDSPKLLKHYLHPFDAICSEDLDCFQAMEECNIAA